MRLPVAILVALLPAFGCSPPAAAVWQLYLLAGQSNMEGYGRVSDLEPGLLGPIPGAVIFHGNRAADATPADGRGVWEPLAAGHGAGFESDGTRNHHSDRFGPELSFARRLLELNPGARIAIVKYALGGTPIDVEASSGFASWDPEIHASGGGNQLGHATAALERALAWTDIDSDGRPDRLEPAGIVWMQGESDADATAKIALRYGDNLAGVMSALRRALGDATLPVVIGRISDSGQDDDGRVWDHGELVRRAQAQFTADDDNAVLVTSTDGYAYSDPWHYDSAGFLDLGARFAEAMYELRSRR